MFAIMKLLANLGITSSKGVFRTLSILLFIVAEMPEFAEYKPVLTELAVVLGAAGVSKAVIVAWLKAKLNK